MLVHSDQGIQYTSSDWRRILGDHNLEASMSRRGNCHDNAVAESFFNLLKREDDEGVNYRSLKVFMTAVLGYNFKWMKSEDVNPVI